MTPYSLECLISISQDVVFNHQPPDSNSRGLIAIDPGPISESGTAASKLRIVHHPVAIFKKSWARHQGRYSKRTLGKDLNIPRSTLDNNKKPLASIHGNKVETANCHSELARPPS